MNKEKIIELVKIFKSADYRDFFGAVILNEKIDCLHDLDNVTDSDIKTLEDIYDDFIDNDFMNLLSDEIMDLIYDEGNGNFYYTAWEEE